MTYAEEIRRKQLKKMRKNHHADDTRHDFPEKAKVPNQTSSEMFDEILSKLKKMGDKGELNDVILIQDFFSMTIICQKCGT